MVGCGLFVAVDEVMAGEVLSVEVKSCNAGWSWIGLVVDYHGAWDD